MTELLQAGTDIRTVQELLGHWDVSTTMTVNVLFAPPEAIDREVAAVLESFGTPHQGAGTGPTHIFNLGHGISQYTPPEHVKVLVDAVHAHSKRIRARS